MKSHVNKALHENFIPLSLHCAIDRCVVEKRHFTLKFKSFVYTSQKNSCIESFWVSFTYAGHFLLKAGNFARLLLIIKKQKFSAFEIFSTTCEASLKPNSFDICWEIRTRRLKFFKLNAYLETKKRSAYEIFYATCKQGLTLYASLTLIHRAKHLPIMVAQFD